MIAEADSNRDGKIDYTEFSQMILNEIDTDPRTKAHQQARYLKASFKKNNKWPFDGLQKWDILPTIPWPGTCFNLGQTINIRSRLNPAGPRFNPASC